MSTEAIAAPAPSRRASARAQQDPAWVRWALTALALGVVGLLVVVPVVNVFAQALREGVGAYWKNLFGDPDTRHSILLTLTVVPIALVANVVFGVAAAWAIARFDFPGRSAADRADRSAVFGVAGRGGADVRADLRPAGLLRAVPAPRTATRSCRT